MPAPVTIANLKKTFGSSVRAVDDVSLEIGAGELFFLLGPSGCGKTTLLRCVAGFCIPDSGTVRIGNQDITRLAPHERDTGMVFQSYALWPHMTVRENVAFGLEQRSLTREERRRRVAEALETVQMSDRAEYKPNQLSGGQQQRVALARALVIRPKCLLLDEPLSNLDAKLRLEMRTEVRRICKQAGLTAIYVTHDQKEALSIADRLAILNHGRIEQSGEPRDVYLRPNSRFTASFIGETNLLPGIVTAVEGDMVTVHTLIGDIMGTAGRDDHFEPGTAATVSIRPEIVRVGAPPTAHPNTFRGMLHDTAYLGELAQHRISIPSSNFNNVEIKAFEMNPRFAARDDHFEKVAVWFSPDEAVILAE